jgi:hypothetical protein
MVNVDTPVSDQLFNHSGGGNAIDERFYSTCQTDLGACAHGGQAVQPQLCGSRRIYMLGDTAEFGTGFRNLLQNVKQVLQ